MAGLQRSSVSFRRQGSSGVVWQDRFLSGDLQQMKKRLEKEEAEDKQRELRSSKSVGSSSSNSMLARSQSVGGGGNAAWLATKVSPAVEPPSPKVSTCGLCGPLGKSKSTKQPKSSKR